MTQRATAANLRAARTKTIIVNVGDVESGDMVPTEFVIQKLKAGQRKVLQAECVDELGEMDLERANRMSVHLCVVDPELTEEDVEFIDLPVVIELADAIVRHTHFRGMAQALTPDPEEGSDAVKSFRLEDGSTAVGERVDADSADAANGLDA